jgi:hypothetical protein
MDIPSGYTLHSLEKDAVTLTVDATHSVAQPHLVIVERRVPTYNGSKFNQPTYRIRVIRGNVDENGDPIGERTLVDCQFRWEISNDVTFVSSVLSPLNDVLAITDFALEAFGSQTLPG